VIPVAADGSALPDPQADLLIPFVRDIVISVDTVEGLVIDPPPGLLTAGEA